jgi:hypothetical protein
MTTAGTTAHSHSGPSKASLVLTTLDGTMSRLKQWGWICNQQSFKVKFDRKLGDNSGVLQ